MMQQPPVVSHLVIFLKGKSSGTFVFVHVASGREDEHLAFDSVLPRSVVGEVRHDAWPPRHVHLLLFGKHHILREGHLMFEGDQLD